MKHLIDRVTAIITGDGFFQDHYLCKANLALSRFRSAIEHARAFYAKERELPIAKEFIHDTWSDNLSKIESYFIDEMDEHFMSNGIINGTMVFTDKKSHAIERAYLSRILPGQLIERIISTNLNSAFIQGKARKATLINSMHHLHHVMKFEQSTGRKIAGMKSIVEFGGGYGNMARIVQNYSAVERYDIIDLPLFSCIQYAFLSTLSGQEQVSLYGDTDHGKTFNLIPLSRFCSLNDLKGELFLSTWALSESTPAVFHQVMAYDWFGAQNLLLAYSTRWQPWQEEELIASLKDKGWSVVIEAIPFLPESYYLFATR